MSQIKVKYFGPIKEGLSENDGWMDIRKVTAFLGNQGSGKSVVAKLISTFAWMEKVLTRGDYDKDEFEEFGHLLTQRLPYHRIENYVDKKGRTELEYKGESYQFRYADNHLTITEVRNGPYDLPQIVYVPAERNFISYVQSPMASKQISPALSEFVEEVNIAASGLSGRMLLPINEAVFLEYQETGNIFYLEGEDYRLNLTEASSGFQSLVPMYLVAWHLSENIRNSSGNVREPLTAVQRERIRKRFREINENPSMSDEIRRIALSEVAKDFTKTAFVNIVEEPEQNLFPSSQWDMLIQLLEINNKNSGNKLIITSHSPYLVNYLSIAIQGAYLKTKVDQGRLTVEVKAKKLAQIKAIVPLGALTPDAKVVIYQLDEKTGTISKLPDPEGIPSDKNFLNQSLRHGNELFDQLLEIEQEL
jgi:predicted ATPase